MSAKPNVESVYMDSAELQTTHLTPTPLLEERWEATGSVGVNTVAGRL